MKISTFQGALEATARVACCAALFGMSACEPTDSADKSDDTGSSGDTDTSDTSDTMDTDTSDTSDTMDTGDTDTGDSQDTAVEPTDPDVDDDGDGYTENTGDCDDGDPAVFPGAADVSKDCGFAECNESIAGVFSEASPTPDAATESCCLLVAQYYDKNYDDLDDQEDWDSDGITAWEHRYECCDLLGWSQSNTMACTPWGPPTPPEMPKNIKEVA